MFVPIFPPFFLLISCILGWNVYPMPVHNYTWKASKLSGFTRFTDNVALR